MLKINFITGILLFVYSVLYILSSAMGFTVAIGAGSPMALYYFFIPLAIGATIMQGIFIWNYKTDKDTKKIAFKVLSIIQILSLAILLPSGPYFAVLASTNLQILINVLIIILFISTYSLSWFIWNANKKEKIRDSKVSVV